MVIDASNQRLFNGRQRWLFRAQRLQGESLSSLVERCAAANAVSAQQFLSHLRLRTGALDLDRLDISAVDMYEQAFGYPAGTLADTTLSSLVGQVFLRLPQQGLAEWCAGPGIRSKRADAVCVHCLAEGTEFYRRLHWRAAYVSRCDLHHSDLIDQCPKCRLPIPSLAQLRERSITSYGPALGRRSITWPCLGCGHVLRGDSQVADGQCTSASDRCTSWRPYQKAILNAHHAGGDVRSGAGVQPPWAALGCSFTYQFLAGIRALLALMHSPNAGKGLREILAGRIDCEPAQLFAGGVRGQPVEVYPVENRRLALDAMAALLADGIDGLLATLEKAKMTSSTLLLTDRYVPNWLHAPIGAYLNGTRYSHSSAEIAAAREVAARAAASASTGEGGDRRRTVAAAGGSLSASTSVSLTKTAIGRLLGSRDSKALDAQFGRLKRRYTRQEAMTFFNKAIEAVPSVPISRTQRQVVIRTLLILLGVAVRGQTVEEVCAWTKDEMRAMLCAAPQDIQRRLVATLQESEHGHAAVLLASRFGARLRGASTRLCAARLLSNHGAAGTWNSANALSGVLAPTTSRQEGSPAVRGAEPPTHETASDELRSDV